MPLKVREIIKLIEADGWYLVTTAGSHRQFKHPLKPGRVTIAGKPSAELPPGTERSILRASRAGPEDSMTSYAVVIERASDDGYGAWCPDLPGCVALADTEDAVLAEMRQAIELHLAGLREDGQPIPHPSTVAATVITLDAA